MSTVFNFTFVPWFRSVAPYIHMHRGKTFVVGVVGEAIAAGKLAAIATDLALIQSMGVRIVLVHGFRPQVNEQLHAKGHEPRYSHGMRITDEVALDCAQEAAGQLRYEIEAAFSQGLPNTPMAGARVRVISGNFITARPMGIIDGVDFKHTGVVPIVDLARIYALAAGDTAVNTHDRLLGAATGGAISEQSARDLRDALEFLAFMRIQHQARQMAAGEKPDNYLHRDELSNFERTQLKDAFAVVASLQGVLAQRYRM